MIKSARRIRLIKKHTDNHQQSIGVVKRASSSSHSVAQPRPRQRRVTKLRRDNASDNAVVYNQKAVDEIKTLTGTANGL